MELDINLSNYISDEISVIESNLLFRGFNDNIQDKRICMGAVSVIVDKLGAASAKSQGLLNPVTNALKFQHSNQIIYLLTDFSLKNDKAIGFLKMGWKRLFLFDLKGIIQEKQCFCILDFYIHESKQREGHGKRLFDFMLQDNCVLPEQLPIDCPSKKSLQFLCKHYGLKTIIPQANNFVVFEEFFTYV